MALPPLPCIHVLAESAAARVPVAECSPCGRCEDDGSATGEELAEGQPDYSGSAMLALYPPPELADALAIDGGLPASEMHVTIAYVGDAADVDPEALRAAAEALSARAPVAASISGHARFTGGDQDVIVALADSPQIEELRADALAVLAEAGIAQASEHGYTPHLTIQYLGADDPDPVGRLETLPVTFGAISAVHGEDRTGYEFIPDGALAESAARALAEATIDLSSLEGIWKTVYGRQDDLYAAQAAKAARVWRKIVRDLDVAAMIAAFRKAALMGADGAPAAGTDHEDPDARKHRKREVKAAAAAAAAGMLASYADSPAYDDLLAVITTALTLAAGEGFASALAVAASEAGHAGFDWAAASKDGQRGPGADIAAEVAAAIVAGTVTDLSVLLSRLAAEGATAAAMVTAVSAALRTARALDVGLTHVMAASIAAAMRGVYDAADVMLLDFVTAGDTKVCPVCEDLEAHNPYRAEDFPAIPQHPLCRCIPMPAGDAPVAPSFYNRYLTAA